MKDLDHLKNDITVLSRDSLFKQLSPERGVELWTFQSDKEELIFNSEGNQVSSQVDFIKQNSQILKSFV